jgi:hypothetical protein
MSSDLGTIFGSGGFVISIISMIYAAINHKRIRAKCCGRSLDFEINIDSTEEAGQKKAAAGTGLQEHQSIDVPTPIIPPPSSKNLRPATPLSFDTIRKIQLFAKKRDATIIPVAEDDDGSTHIHVQPTKNPRKWVRDVGDESQ